MNILLKTNVGGCRGREPDFVGGRGRDRKPNFVTCSARLVGGWVVMAWGTKSYLGLA